MIRRANLDGSQQEDLYRTPGGGHAFIAADTTNHQLYFPSIEAGGIQRSDLEGSNVELAITVPDYVSALFVDSINRQVYWGQTTGQNAIWRSNLDGSARELLVETDPSVTAIAVDPSSENLYWTNFSSGDIWRTSPGSLSTESIFGTNSLGFHPRPTGLAINSAAGHLYASDSAMNVIIRVGLEGSDPVRLITTGVISPEEIAIDHLAQRVYWANRSGGVASRTEYDYYIMSAKLDGTDLRKEFIPQNEWGSHY